MSAKLVRHDFGKRASLTIRDRKALRAAAEPVSEAEHARRTLHTECVGCGTLGFIFGSATTAVIFALFVWWAPV
jgi:hypothetical protein